ncbi:MAG TPA: AgmX/PglI C-terminal domain-containing protein [Polyangiaceae bacterium]|nr:AgmX/PglI C-terminal domain-containing protein [Polyangiaceae bacterium]
MKLLRLSLLGLALGTFGCSFAARSPEMYRDDTRALLETRNEQIRTCYDDLLKSNPALQGSVTVRFVVEPDTGMLRDVATDPAGTTAPPEVAQCVTSALQGIALQPGDKSEGHALFVYEFSPGAPPAPTPG